MSLERDMGKVLEAVNGIRREMANDRDNTNVRLMDIHTKVEAQGTLLAEHIADQTGINAETDKKQTIAQLKIGAMLSTALTMTWIFVGEFVKGLFNQ